jgi:hypothetical protein
MNWNDIRNYMVNNYNDTESAGGVIAVSYPINDEGNSEWVRVEANSSANGDEWIQFVSAVGVLPQSNLPNALELANSFPSGGFVFLRSDEIGSEILCARNTCLSSSLNINDIDKYLAQSAILANMTRAILQDSSGW